MNVHCTDNSHVSMFELNKKVKELSLSIDLESQLLGRLR